jgi:hypothetical protein
VRPATGHAAPRAAAPARNSRRSIGAVRMRTPPHAATQWLPDRKPNCGKAFSQRSVALRLVHTGTQPGVGRCREQDAGRTDQRRMPGAAFCLNSPGNQLAAPRLSPDLASAASLLLAAHSAGYCQNLAKTPLGTPDRRAKQSQEQPALRLTIVNAAPYVGRMTKAANEGRSLACQGLHNGPVLAYGFSCTVLLTVPCHDF